MKTVRIALLLGLFISFSMWNGRTSAQTLPAPFTPSPPVQFLLPASTAATLSGFEGSTIIVVGDSPGVALVGPCVETGFAQQFAIQRAVLTDSSGSAQYLSDVIPLAIPPLLPGTQLAEVQRLGRCTAAGVQYERYEGELK